MLQSPEDRDGAGSATPPGQERPAHSVQFYQSDADLTEAVSEFMLQALAARDPLIVVATPAHQAAFSAALAARGISLEGALARGELVLADAEELLAAFMRGAMPDRALFEHTIGGLLDRLSIDGTATVRAYGEMVDVLWRSDNLPAALRLEEMWSDLQRARRFSLLCAYVMGNFSRDPAQLLAVCERHSHVHISPPERAPAEQARAELLDPRHAHALAAEIAQRKQIEIGLRDSLRELRRTEAELRRSQERLLENERQLQLITDSLPVLVSYVDAEQRYRSVNGAYEQWFGRPRSEFVGKHLREILGPAAYESLLPQIRAALAGTTVKFEAITELRDAGRRFIEASYVPHHTADERVAGFVSLVADISERKRSELAREATAQRTERLMRITAAIADAVSEAQVHEAIVDQVAAALGSSSAALWLLRDDGRSAQLVRAQGYSSDAQQRFGHFAVEGAGGFPAFDAITRSEPILIDSQAELITRYPQLANALTPGRAYRIACLPLVAQGRTLGAVGFTFDDAPAIGDEQRRFLLLVARYSAQAIERLRLLGTAQRSRAQAEAAASRLRVLSQASQAFSEAGANVSAALQAIAEQLTVEHADGCAFTLIEGDHQRLAALHHRDPDATASARHAIETQALPLDAGLTGRVTASGDALLIPVVDHAALLDTAAPNFREYVRRYRPRSVIIVPLRSRGQSIGTLCAMRRDAIAYTEEDKRFMQELAERAALAIESTRLHHDNQQARLRAELLYGLAAAVIGAESAEQVMEAALDAIGQALGSERAAVLAFDSGGVMRFKAFRGLSPEYRAAVEGHSPWARDAVAPEPVLVPDVKQDATLAAFVPLFEREGIGALGFIPLVAGSKLIGKFMVYYAEPRVLAANELSLAKAIANHVAAALERFHSMAELERTVRFNQMFTGILGHDLRNPLSAIMMAAHLVRIRDEGELTKPLLRVMTSGARMSRMIDQLLDFTRVRLGTGIPLNPSACNVVELLQQALEELSDVHPEWEVRVEQAGNTRGTWDADRLVQVFSNLLANALQHGVAEHGLGLRVDGQSSELVRVEIHNMGAVPSALLPHLFEPMTGGDRRRAKSRGLGLGLYISQEIVKAHGGRIEVRSSDTEGTTFVLLLPRTRALPRNPSA